MKFFDYRSPKVIILFLAVVFMGIFIMPQSWKQNLPFEGMRENLLAKKVSFGLDLVGGRQIDYQVDLSEVEKRNADDDPENDRDPDKVVESIGQVLRGRIDPQGTRELNIYPAEFNEEKHVIVEITDDLDNEETLRRLQQIIDLKFKTQNAEVSEEEVAVLKGQAEVLLSELSVENFEEKANEEQNGNDIRFNEDREFWRDSLDAAFDEPIAREIWNTKEGTLIPRLIERTSNTIAPGASGQYEIVQVQEFVFVKVGIKELKERENTEPGEEFSTVQSDVSEKNEEAEKLLDIPEEFQDLLLALDEGERSEVLESETEYAFFEILPKAEGEVATSVSGVYVAKDTPNAKEAIDAARARLEPVITTTEEQNMSLSEIVYSIAPGGWADTDLGGAQFKRARVSQDPNTGAPLVEILFNNEGAKMFEELTEASIGKPIAIFVGGVLVSAPTVQQKISGGSAVITLGSQNYQQAQEQAVVLARELNGGSTPAPFQEKGQFRIGAALGKDSLQKSLLAGLMGLGILSLWMIFFYRFLGFIAVLALTFYAIAIVFLLQADLSFGFASLLGILVFAMSMKSFSSLERNDLISLIIAMILGMTITFVSFSPIVLTLAGVAGIVLSIGMAVDANILIFERVKEELRKGKNFSAASQTGFERAWSSIRDSNVSSLITCLILWIFGSAVIKGFAVALAMGIVISMLTAITVTRSLVGILVRGKVEEKKKMLIYGVE